MSNLLNNIRRTDEKLSVKRQIIDTVVIMFAGIALGIISVLFNMTFAYGWIYFDIYSWLELLVFVCGLVVTKRRTMKETIIMTATGVALAFAFHSIAPFPFG